MGQNRPANGNSGRLSGGDSGLSPAQRSSEVQAEIKEEACVIIMGVIPLVGIFLLTLAAWFWNL